MAMRIKGETRFTADGFELKLGEIVYSKKLYWSETRGTQNVKDFGSYVAIEGRPDSLRLKHASRDWHCKDCGAAIVKHDMHGSDYYTHYCLECVTPHKGHDVRFPETRDQQ